VRDTLRLFAQTGPMHMVSAAGDIVLNALTKSIVARAQKQILLESEEILLRAHKFRVEVNGSFLNMDASGVMSGTTGKFTAFASAHELPGPKDQMVDLSPKKICVECMLKAARGGAALVPR
jgi:type VI secretion system secreted protein VgrG